MSMHALVKGIFKNGKVRTVGVLSSKGMEFKNQFDEEDRMFLSNQLEYGAMSFNRCLELGKFTEVKVIFHGSYCNNHGEGKKSSSWGLILDETKRIEAKSLINELNDIILAHDEELNS